MVYFPVCPYGVLPTAQVHTWCTAHMVYFPVCPYGVLPSTQVHPWCTSQYSPMVYFPLCTHGVLPSNYCDVMKVGNNQSSASTSGSKQYYGCMFIESAALRACSLQHGVKEHAVHVDIIIWPLFFCEYVLNSLYIWIHCTYQVQYVHIDWDDSLCFTLFIMYWMSFIVKWIAVNGRYQRSWTDKSWVCMTFVLHFVLWKVLCLSGK